MSEVRGFTEFVRDCITAHGPFEKCKKNSFILQAVFEIFGTYRVISTQSDPWIVQIM